MKKLITEGTICVEKTGTAFNSSMFPSTRLDFGDGSSGGVFCLYTVNPHSPIGTIVYTDSDNSAFKVSMYVGRHRKFMFVMEDAKELVRVRGREIADLACLRFL